MLAPVTEHLVRPSVRLRDVTLADADLFETTSLHRVEASTDVDNLAEQRSLEKAGFTREGVNRQAQFRGGTYHDLVLFARLRSDPRHHPG